MDKVGHFEETVIKEEMECELLQKKQQMVQAAINRRELIDEAAIDAELESCRTRMLQEAAGPEAPQEYAELDAEGNDELQSLYRQIVKCFHPEVHPEQTEVHRQLFLKAQEAYRLKNLSALRLIHEMLFSTQEDELALGLLLQLIAGNQTDDGKEEMSSDKNYTTDYSLASQIYFSFDSTEGEAAIHDELLRCRQAANIVMEEMDDMRLRFPYTASEILSDPAKIEAYKDELAHRLRSATAERERRTKEIRKMIESVAANE